VKEFLEYREQRNSRSLKS